MNQFKIICMVTESSFSTDKYIFPFKKTFNVLNITDNKNFMKPIITWYFGHLMCQIKQIHVSIYFPPKFYTWRSMVGICSCYITVCVCVGEVVRVLVYIYVSDTVRVCVYVCVCWGVR